MSAVEDTRREYYETGREPEYFVHDITRWEDAGDGMVRLYLTQMRGGFDKLEYTAITSAENLDRLGIVCRQIAAMYLARWCGKRGH